LVHKLAETTAGSTPSLHLTTVQQFIALTKSLVEAIQAIETQIIGKASLQLDPL